MVTWTSDDVRAYQARLKRVRATEPECPERRSLVHTAQREAKGGNGAQKGTGERMRVIFTVYAQRPLDWDNYRLKDVQDCLVESGLLVNDDWRILEGLVRSEKAHTKAEERTEIEIIGPVA